MKPIAIVDVDETLWPFHDAVSNTGLDLGIKIPKRTECVNWEAIFKYAGECDVVKVFDTVHSQQCSYKPYADAEAFLKFMTSRFYVMIVSHRKVEYRYELMDWLNMNKLPYNELVVTSDKNKLIDNPRVEVVVDDRDSTIIYACRKGKVGTGLRKPWNMNATYPVMVKGQERVVPLVLFESLTDIADFLSNYHSVHKYDKALEEECCL
jgi:hypothetical protein